MKQPTKKQLREQIKALNYDLYEIWKQLPKGELKDSIEAKHGKFTYAMRLLGDIYINKRCPPNDYYIWLTKYCNTVSDKGFMYYESPLTVYPMPEEDLNSKTEGEVHHAQV